MKRQFLTTKVVEVEEMTRKEYAELRGWVLTEEGIKHADDKVFKVIYSDGYESYAQRKDS